MRTAILRAVLLAAAVAGCKVGPDYTRPDVVVQTSYRELVPAAGTRAWPQARPSDQMLRAKWWEAFGDPRLDTLEDAVSVSNQSLKSAEAQFREARAMVGAARSAEFPALSVGSGIATVHESPNTPYLKGTSQTYGEFVLPVDLSYEVDLWGRVARSVAASTAQAQASAADAQTAALSLHAELAIDYFDLRNLDSQKHLLDRTVSAYADALRLTENRAQGGAAPESDVAEARTQLDSTRVQQTDVTVQRAQFEHAIAVLIGKPPSAFSLPPAPLSLHPPAIPVALPSTLLQRRPDIAAAERRVAAANEQIGIAQVAFYPSLSLGGNTGFEGTTIANWLAWPSLFWAVGPSMSQTLFDGGLRRARSRAARAAYEATVADYRQTTLTAFQQVENALAALRILAQEAEQEADAVQSAQLSLQLSTNRYVGGRDSYLQVLTAQTAVLTDQRNDADILRRRMDASVLLIKALGGGWDASTLPTPAALRAAADPS